MHWLMLLLAQGVLLFIVLLVLSDSWFGIVIAMAGCGALTWGWFARKPGGMKVARPTRDPDRFPRDPDTP